MKSLVSPIILLSAVACSDAAPLEDTDTSVGANTEDTAAVTGRVVLNEVSASGDFVADDAGDDGEDWLELAVLDGAVDLGGYTLTDGSTDPWPLPPITVQPGTFRMVWCDDDASQGSWHAAFKLSADGEHLVLASADGPVDETTTPAAQDGLTWSRGAGDGAWAFANPTPASANAD